ncbi:endonuclease-reverse transcriptase [Aphelenchoides avenae]|nr:endonuclease-reverse transcriptase [Aphelenchus avenae]KAH7710160.1 endonuclease-reverse transcriptase [Aphelenchus avenae]
MGLRLKPSKCELLSTLPEGEEPIKVYGEEIKQVPSFCYLGSIITADGSVKEDVSQRIRKARAAFATLQRCLWSTNVSQKMKLRVYMTAIPPILLYASETWPLTQSEEERLSRAERNFLRRALGIRQMDMVSNQELWRRVTAALAPKRLMDVATTIRRNRLKLLGHHLRRGEQRLTRIAIEYTGETEWRRPPGGTRTTWSETVKRDLERLRIRELPQFRGTEAVIYWNRGEWLRVITMLAQDREAWHQMIEKLCGREANTIGSRSTDPS